MKKLKSQDGSHKNHAQCKCHVTMRRILKKIKLIKRSNEKEISHYWNNSQNRTEKHTERSIPLAHKYNVH